jgi:hypothetical protein
MNMRKKIEQHRSGLSHLLFAVTTIFLLVWMVPAIPATDLGLSEADCRCCHGTTLADRHHLLVNTGGLECLSCHTFTFNDVTLEYDVSVTRDCILCHTGSLADRHHLLVDQVTYDCFTCHTLIFDPVTMQNEIVFNNACQAPPPAVTTGAISGSVTDAAGTALGWVSVATSDGVYTTLATDTGNYELLDITAGSYTLVASLEGYIGSSQDVTITEGQTLTINFSLSQLPVPATISGVVLDTSQTPLEAANIASADGVYSATSGLDGTYTLNNVAEGSVQLTVDKPGYIDASQTVTVTNGNNISLDFTLSEAIEICTDGIDNNANGFTDCDDMACADATNCQPPPVEICGDTLDNDDNGLTDCNDPVCIGTGSCESPVAEICNDQIDNNGDNLFDCDDPMCSTAMHCIPENCEDGIDNNGDGLFDCDDPLCIDTRICRRPPVEICDDDIDNDDSGEIDCDDEKCSDSARCNPHTRQHERCRNEIDDNNDGLIDCDDPLCFDRAACLDEICTNDLDDDADGRIDCEDRECRELPVCAGQTLQRPLEFEVTASEDEDGHEAEKAADGDMTTYWWVNDNKRNWVMLDLEGKYPIDRVNIHWHTQYALRYKVRISKNGRYWRTVKVVNNSDGGTDINTFITKDAHFVLIQCINAANTGFAINEIEVLRSANDEEN